MTPKILFAAAISAALAAPIAAFADDEATLWPDKAKPTEQSAKQKARTTPRADQAMSGNSAAAGGSTRPAYDPPAKPTAPKRAAESEPSSAERAGHARRP